MNENTNNKPENPKAFPNVDPNFFGANDSHGMDLRDHYAGLAMQAMCAGEGARMVADRDGRYDETNWKEVVAMNSYEIADAMLTHREKTK